MTDQSNFIDALKNVADIIRTSEHPLTEDEIFAYFSDMELNSHQKQMILDYLMNQPEVDSLPEESKSEETGNEEIEDKEKISSVYKMYLEDLDALPQYSENKKRKFYEQLLDGDEKVIEPISNIWLKNVIKIAEKYMEEKFHIEDLIQEGNVALFMKLQDCLGMNKMIDLESELYQAIEVAIMTYASELNGEKELEDSVLAKISLVDQAKKLLAVDKEATPSLEELSEYTKISIEELEDLLAMIETENQKNNEQMKI